MDTPDPGEDDGPREAAVGSELEEGLHILFRQPHLLRDSLTHRSYAFEHGGVTNNERLEFLGDAVLAYSWSENSRHCC